MKPLIDPSGARFSGQDIPVQLLSLGRARRPPGMSTGWRTLSAAVLVQAVGGSYVLEYEDGRQYAASSGEGFAVPARQRHRISCPGPRSIVSRWLHVLVELAPGLDLFSVMGVPALLPRSVARSVGAANAAMLQFVNLQKQEMALAAQFQMRSRLLEVIAAIFSRASDASLPDNIGRIWPALTMDGATNPSVPDMARRCGLSLSRFYELFRAAMGETPNEWLIGRRMKQAGQMLEHSGMSCAEIAVQCGIEDAAYFGRLFRRRFGLTPMTYRRLARSGQLVS